MTANEPEAGRIVSVQSHVVTGYVGKKYYSRRCVLSDQYVRQPVCDLSSPALRLGSRRREHHAAQQSYGL